MTVDLLKHVFKNQMCGPYLKVGYWWPEPLFTQKRKLIGQLQKMQDHVEEAYLNLQRSSVFNAEMFLKVYICSL